MRTIINSKYFSDFLKSGLKANSTEMEINGPLRHITLIGEDEILIQVHIDEDSEHWTQTNKVDPMQMVNLINFLDMLPTQPVCLIFNKVNDDDICIDLRSVEISFNPS